MVEITLFKKIKVFMKYIKFLLSYILSSTLLLLPGCSTNYKASGFNGGYSEIKTTPDSFIVTFTGNGFTTHEKVMQYALKRASELTLENGYKYFSVISSKDHSKSYDYSTTNKNTRDFSSTYSGAIIKPQLIMEIQCFNEKNIPNMIDAEYFLHNN